MSEGSEGSARVRSCAMRPGRRCGVLLGGALLAWITLSATGVGSARAESADSMVAGGNHTCALTTAGGMRCWGYNGSGQLGDGTTTSSSVPLVPIGLGSDVAAITAGIYHSCALTTGDVVRCWGRNGNGQLGDGTTANRSTPVAVSGLGGGITALAAGTHHTCALSAGGGVLCWGSNSHGQLGDGTTTDSSVPVAVSGLGSGVAAVSGGSNHTCALTTGGGVVCWGGNGQGQLGNGTLTGSTSPVAVSGLGSGVAAVAAGHYHTCALTTGGDVLCWGANDHGQTSPDPGFKLLPVTVSGLGSAVAALAASGEHTCALTTAGGVLCWGQNFDGQLGDGTTTDSSVPVAVSGLGSGVAGVAAGRSHSCAITTGGGALCWGQNFYGQLGDGTTTDSSVPVTVSGLAAAAVPGLTVPALAALVAALGLTSRRAVRRRPRRRGPA